MVGFTLQLLQFLCGQIGYHLLNSPIAGETGGMEGWEGGKGETGRMEGWEGGKGERDNQ